MSLKRTAATTRRILLQVRHDPRTIALMIVLPCLLMALVRYMFDHDRTLFSTIGPQMLGIFPSLLMFIITSVTMLRERSSGTLERLMTTPLAKLDLLAGYVFAFGLIALGQAVLTCLFSFGPLGLQVHHGALAVVAFAIAGALLGSTLGVFLSAFAETEFQAVQFMPAVFLPQFTLSGLFVNHNHLPALLRLLADVLPLYYVVDGIQRELRPTPDGWLVARDAIVVIGCAGLALLLGAATLRRRTA
ncbi:MAG: ABC transporter permease [Chloroflexota bacterium]|nr:ABC transporter permease [Chloroflexota bacterium]